MFTAFLYANYREMFSRSRTGETKTSQMVDHYFN